MFRVIGTHSRNRKARAAIVNLDEHRANASGNRDRYHSRDAASGDRRPGDSVRDQFADEQLGRVRETGESPLGPGAAGV